MVFMNCSNCVKVSLTRTLSCPSGKASLVSSRKRSRARSIKSRGSKRVALHKSRKSLILMRRISCRIILAEKKRLDQGWPTFLSSGPNFRYISVGGPKISSKKIWRAKKRNIFYHLYRQKSIIYSENFEKIFAGPFKMSKRAKNGPRAPGWPPLH